MERSAPYSRPSPTGLVFFSLGSPGSSGGACVLCSWCSWVTSCGYMGPQLPLSPPTPRRQGRPGCSYCDLGAAAPPQRLSQAMTPLLGEGWFRAVPDHSSLSWSLASLYPGLCPATLRRPLGVPVPKAAHRPGGQQLSQCTCFWDPGPQLGQASFPLSFSHGSHAECPEHQVSVLGSSPRLIRCCCLVPSTVTSGSLSSLPLAFPLNNTHWIPPVMSSSPICSGDYLKGEVGRQRLPSLQRLLRALFWLLGKGHLCLRLRRERSIGRRVPLALPAAPGTLMHCGS